MTQMQLPPGFVGFYWVSRQISSSWGLKALRMVTAALKSEDDGFLAGKP